MAWLSKPPLRTVRTFTGAWIETGEVAKDYVMAIVRTFTGAWIETRTSSNIMLLKVFAPSRVRGLKHRHVFE